ncbi:MAG: RNA polymerase-binding protein DksA [Giesbergeria sp.]|nr:RNA polymerase-binding protein DksA [Giesbergeria sp.]
MKAETSKTKGVAKAPSAAVKTGAAKAPAKVSEPVAPAVSQPAAAQMPLRSTRPSSRLAQLTVPSMAQSVASTAAKASYTNTMPSTMQVSPPMASTKKDAKLANNWKTKPLEELTDAEVLAMPDSEYMNDTQMAFFRRKLVLLKQDMHNNAGETTEHLREDTVVVPDPADRATIEEEHALELRTRDRERKLLKKIEQSIARIDAGDYGYCDETGEPIGVGRLLARPTATLSLEAQQRRELKQKMFGD